MIKRRFLIFILVFACTLIFVCSAFATDKNADSLADPFKGISVEEMHFDGTSYVQKMKDGRKIIFTVNKEIQQFSDKLFKRYEVPAAAAVILNSKTGRVLAFSQKYSKNYAEQSSVALDASPPAASLFKIITTSALLEKSEISLKTKTCYHGGGGSLNKKHLIDSAIKDTVCSTLKSALGRSTNAIFAKLSDRHLNKQIIKQYAEGFNFNKKIHFDVPVAISSAKIPSNRLERARTAAGFWHTHLSPLHAAMIAQTIAQKGAMLQPYVVDRVEDKEGNVIYKAKTKFLGRPIKPETASQLIEAMKYTVEKGTAKKAFKDSHGISYVSNVEIAGKTGTLHGKKPYRAYSWFVGIAPADNPEIAIAVLVVNKPKWRIKSAGAAAQILKKYFSLKPKK